MAAKKTAAKSSANKPKKMPGKSVAKEKAMVEDYKPSIYLDDKQIPTALKNAKVGQNVTLTVSAKIVGKSQSEDNGGVSNSLRMELNQIKPVTKKQSKG